MGYSPPGSSVHGISHSRKLEWVANSSSKGFFWPRDQTRVSRIASRLFTIWAARGECITLLKATDMWTQAVKNCIAIKHTFHLLLKKLNARALIFKINWNDVQGSWVNLSGRASAKAGCQRSSLQFNCPWQGQNLWVLMRAPPARFSPVDTGASHFYFPALWPTTCPYTSRFCFTFPLSPYTLTPATVACAAVPPLKVGPWTRTSMPGCTFSLECSQLSSSLISGFYWYLPISSSEIILSTNKPV